MSVRQPIILGLAATGFVSLAAAAHAADLDYGYGDAPPPPVAEEKVEFGSGWYIRGDVGATKLPSLDLAAPSSLPTPANPGALPSAPSATISNGSRVGYDASLGAGYQFTRWFRTDVVADFHQPLSTFSQTPQGSVFCPTGVTAAGVYADGQCTGSFRGNLHSYDVLVNAYIDIGTWWDRVTPYVGAGAGISFGHYQYSSSFVQGNNVPYVNISYVDPRFNTTYTNNYDRYVGSSYQVFAYALMAGVAIDVFDHTKLDIGYRYLNLGSIPGVSGNLAQHEVRAGVRYMIDN